MKQPDWWYPELAQSVDGLALLSRALLASLPGGIQRGRRSGPEQEFSQYRHYMPGDDLRWLDWKAYARSRRLYVKEAEITSGMPVWLVLDASRSMEHSAGNWSKMNYARALAALLARLALQQHDRPSLLLINSEKETLLQFASHPRFFEQMLHTLAETKPAGSWPANGLSALHQLSGALLLVISDFHQQENELEQDMKQLRDQGNEVLALQILAEEELNPGLFKAGTVLRDLESRQKLTVSQATETAKAYFAHQESWFHEQGISLDRFLLNELPHRAIPRFLDLHYKTSS